MFRFALKHMAIRLAKNLLIGFSVVISLTVSLMAYNISTQVRDGIVASYRYYDTIIGPSGSQAQLVLNTLLYTDQPLGLIGYENYKAVMADKRVAVAIPFAQGDNYSSVRIVGTHRKYVGEYKLAQGRNFSDTYEVVLGHRAAKGTGLKIGDTFFSTHGLITDIHSHAHNDENKRYAVVGILAETSTSVDHVIFTDINTVWATHGIQDRESAELGDEHNEHHEHDEHNKHQSEYGVTAILIRSTSLTAQMSLASEYNKKPGLQAVNPSMVMREIISNVDVTKNIVYVLSGVILIMNFLMISAITTLNMIDVKKDIVLLRLIGVSKTRIEMMIYIQNSVISLGAVLLGFVASRGLMQVLADVIKKTGIILDTSRFYSVEIVIMAVVVVMTFLPSVASIRSTMAGEVISEK